MCAETGCAGTMDVACAFTDRNRSILYTTQTAGSGLLRSVHVGTSEEVPHIPGSDGEVLALNLVRTDHIAEAGRCVHVFRGDQQTTRVAVEAIHDTVHIMLVAEDVVCVPAECVSERVLIVPHRRMNRKPGRFIDDQDILVLIDDRQRDLGLDDVRAVLGLKDIAAQPVARREDLLQEAPVPVQDEPVDTVWPRFRCVANAGCGGADGPGVCIGRRYIGGDVRRFAERTGVPKVVERRPRVALGTKKSLHGVAVEAFRDDIVDLSQVFCHNLTFIEDCGRQSESSYDFLRMKNSASCRKGAYFSLLKWKVSLRPSHF